MNKGDDNSNDQLLAQLREITARLKRIEHHLGITGQGEETDDGERPSASPTEVPPPEAATEPGPPRQPDVTSDAEPDPDPQRKPEPDADLESTADPEPAAEYDSQPQPEARPESQRKPEPAADTTEDAGAENAPFDFNKWIMRIGIGLVLAAVAFFLHWGVERGYVTDPMKVGIGFLVASTLAAGGWGLRKNRRRLAQVLLGGGIGAYYVTIFGAYELYELIPHPVAFVLMAVVTTAAFIAAHFWSEPVLSVIGALGGFLTPFVLAGADPNRIGLMIYHGTLVAGMSAIYLARGWRHVLSLTAVGGWVLLLLLALSVADGAELTALELLFAQGCVFLVWIAVGIAPLVRLHSLREPADGDEPERLDRARRGEPAIVGLAASGSALCAMLTSKAFLDLPDVVWTIGFALVAALFVLLAELLDDGLSEGMLSIQRLIAAFFCALAIWHAAPSGTWFGVGVSLQMVAMHLLGRRWEDKAVVTIAHIIAGLIAFWLIIHLDGSAPDEALPFFHEDGIAAGIVILSMVVVSIGVDGLVAKPAVGRRAYRYVAHLFLLWYIAAQIAGVEGGNYIVTGMWGVYAIIILVVGLVMSHSEIKWVGFVTLGLSVLKLILFDMQEADTFWRVAVFFGLGSMLLVVSYLSPKLEELGAESEKGTDGTVDEAETESAS